MTTKSFLTQWFSTIVLGSLANGFAMFIIDANTGSSHEYSNLYLIPLFAGFFAIVALTFSSLYAIAMLIFLRYLKSQTPENTARIIFRAHTIATIMYLLVTIWLSIAFNDPGDVAPVYITLIVFMYGAIGTILMYHPISFTAIKEWLRRTL